MKAFNLKSYLTKGSNGSQVVLVKIGDKLFDPKKVVSENDKTIIIADEISEEVAEKIVEVVDTPSTAPIVESPQEEIPEQAPEDSPAQEEEVTNPTPEKNGDTEEEK